MQQIYDMLLKESEVTWKDIIYDLVNSGQVDPWDVDVTKLTQQYIAAVQKMQQMDYFVSGKMLLASAMLLKIKSNRLVQEDISNFDAFLFHSDEEEFEELGDFLPFHERVVDIPKLGVKTPQARKRRVSITDLVSALEKALKVDTRRKLRLQRYISWNKPKIPEKKVDIGKLIQEVYEKVFALFKQKQKIKFSELAPSGEKEEKVLTLLPLLHLHNHKKLTLEQEEPFEEVHVHKFSG